MNDSEASIPTYEETTIMNTDRTITALVRGEFHATQLIRDTEDPFVMWLSHFQAAGLLATWPLHSIGIPREPKGLNLYALGLEAIRLAAEAETERLREQDTEALRAFLDDGLGLSDADEQAEALFERCPSCGYLDVHERAGRCPSCDELRLHGESLDLPF